MGPPLYGLRPAKCGIWLKCFCTLCLYYIFCPRCHFATTPGRSKANICDHKYVIIKIYAHLLLPSRCVLIDCNNILSTHPSGIYIIFDNRRTVYIIYPFSLSQFDILFFYLVKGFPLLCKVLRTLDNIKTIILYGLREKGLFIFTQCENVRLFVYKLHIM